VGGGGGGGDGGNYGGGGGGGQFKNGTFTLTGGTLYAVAVGTGGAHGNTGVTGGNSTFGSTTSIGGSGGYATHGGASGDGTAGATGGNPPAGGGAGCAGVAANGTSGTIGKYGYIISPALQVCGGGGGAGQGSPYTAGFGFFGGGNGGYNNQHVAGFPATAESGGGGGGAVNNVAGAGGSGVVYIKYAANAPVASFDIVLNDTSTNAPSAWIWNYTNLTGSNTPVTFGTSSAAILTLTTPGNYLITLIASNTGGSNTTTKTIGLNLTNQLVYFWNRTS